MGQKFPNHLNLFISECLGGGGGGIRLKNDFNRYLNPLLSDSSFITHLCLFSKTVLVSKLFLTDALLFWRNREVENVNKHLKIADMVT